MSALESIQAGARRVNSARPLWLYYFAGNLAIALIFVAPVFTWLTLSLGHSLYSERLLGNADADFFVEYFLQTNGAPVYGLIGPALALGALYLLLAAFLNAGILGLFVRDPERVTWAKFIAACGRYYRVVLVYGALSLAFYGVALGINALLTLMIGKMTEGAMQEWPAVMLGWGKAAVVLLVFCAVNLFFDVVKILAVIGTGSPFWDALALLRTNLRAASGMFLMLSILSGLFLAAYWGASEWIDATTGLTVVVLLVVRQLYVLSRMWMRLLFFASESEFVRMLMPAQEATEPTC